METVNELSNQELAYEIGELAAEAAVEVAPAVEATDSQLTANLATNLAAEQAYKQAMAKDAAEIAKMEKHLAATYTSRETQRMADQTTANAALAAAAAVKVSCYGYSFIRSP